MGEDVMSVSVAVDSLQVSPFTFLAYDLSQTEDASQPMGWTSENVAADYNISRQDMDEFAYM